MQNEIKNANRLQFKLVDDDNIGHVTKVKIRLKYILAAGNTVLQNYGHPGAFCGDGRTNSVTAKFKKCRFGLLSHSI